MDNNRVCVMGMGYVGLTLSVVLSEIGYKVYGIDVDGEVIDQLKLGKPHFFEKNLRIKLQQQLKFGSISFHTIAPNTTYDTIIISVGTPLKKGSKKPNLEFLNQVINDVGKLIKKGTLICMRSTLPVGCSRKTILPILEKESNLLVGKDFFLASTPERTVEGKALEELRENSQIIGGVTPKCAEKAAKLFLKLTSTVIPVSSIEAAEFSKIIDNTYRDVKFAFANQIAMISESLGLNIHEVIKAANHHYPRNNIPVPSPGVGGPCISKDPHILINMSQKVGFEPEMIKISRKINESYPKLIAKRIMDFFSSKGKSLDELNLLIAGFAFKGFPVTADLRDSTTIMLMNELLNISNCKIFGYDPVVEKKDIQSIKGINMIQEEPDFHHMDALIIANNHQSYKDWDIYEIISNMNKPSLIYDGWCMLDRDPINKFKEIKYMAPGL